jgi:hypothetical protein
VVIPKTYVATRFSGQNVYMKQGYYRNPQTNVAVIHDDGTRRGDSYDDVIADFPSWGGTTTTTTPTPSSPATLTATSSIADGATLAGTVQWKVTSSLSTYRVDYYADNNLLGSSQNAAAYTLDTTKVTNGSHTIGYQIYDATGNQLYRSTAINVAVSNVALTVTTNLTNGQTLKGSVTWTAKPAGLAVARVEFSIDGKLSWTEKASPYYFNGDNSTWNTKTVKNGTHTLKVVAVSTDGRTATVSPTVTVKN